MGTSQIDTWIGDRLLLRGFCHVDRGTSDFSLRAVGVARNPRHLLAIYLAAVEVHLRIRTCGILAQDRVENNQRLHHEEPVHEGDFTQGLNACGQQLGEGRLTRLTAEVGYAVFQRERLQPFGCLLEDQLQKAEAEHHRQHPQLFQQQGFRLLQFVQVNTEGIGIPHRTGRRQINAGHGGGARFRLMIVSDRKRQPAQLAAYGAQLSQRGAHQARVLADFQQRLGPGPSGGGQPFQLGRQRVETLPGGFHASREAVEILGLTDGPPAMPVFAGGLAEVFRHKPGLPQSLFVNHRHLFRHDPSR